MIFSKTISSYIIKLGFLLIFTFYSGSLFSIDSNILGENNICGSNESNNSEKTCEDGCLCDRDFTSFEFSLKDSFSHFFSINNSNNHKAKNKLIEERSNSPPSIYLF